MTARPAPTMVGGWASQRIMIYGLLALILIIPSTDSSDCWELCFEESQRGPGNAEYEQIFELTQIFKKVAATDAKTGSGASNGTAFLLDTTLPRGTKDSDTDQIITIQKKIAQILGFTLPVLTSFNPGFIVKYDDNSAWACDDWKCLGRCDMYDILEDEASNFKTLTSDSDIDRLDDSCEMASTAATTSPCLGTTHNIFAIAVTNSDFKTAEADYTNMDDSLFSGLDILSNFPQFEEDMNDEPDPEFKFYCDKHFPKKAIVGTYTAAARTMASFPSAATNNWPGYTQVTYSPSMKQAAENIANCMHRSCCGSNNPRQVKTINGECSKLSKGYISHYTL